MKQVLRRMDLLRFSTAYLMVSLVTTGISQGRTIREAPGSNFVGEGTNELATALLQGFVYEDRNFVFSPLGYSTILAILAEGARGNTRNELVNVLRLPEDTYAVRKTFKNILETMKERWTLNRPEFHNWFYVYNNNTVDDAYKDVLLENYLTKVQTVERVQIELDFDESSETEIPSDKKDKQQEQTSENQTENEKIYVDIINEKTSAEAEEQIKTVQEEDKNEKGETVEEEKETEKLEEEKQDQSSRREVEINESDNKQEETGQRQSEEAKESEKSTNEDNQNKEATEEEQINTEANKEKTESNTDKNVVSGESKHTGRRSPLSFDPDKDVMSTLTANRIISRESCKSGLSKKSKMIIFNGLYFRGSWKIPFCVTKAAEETSFYVTNTEKKTVDAMHTKGKFNMGLIPELDCTAIELPYEGDRYSLLLLVPNGRDGLPKLTSDLTGYSLSQVYKHLSEQEVIVTIPKFHFQTISHPVDALKKYGLTEIFSTTADLSGISSNEPLVLGDLVQLVTVYVEEGSSETNYLTATNVESTRSTLDESLTALDTTWLKANHPFLFFIRDQTNNVILAAGKVLDPTAPSDELKGKTINN